MPERSRAILKSYFETGDRPTDQQFAEFIDSAINKLDDEITIDPSLNMGLGTDNPAARLHINGDLMLQNGVVIHTFSNDDTLADNSENIIPTQQAIKTYIDNLFAGTVAPFAMDTPPTGWIECDGTALDRIQYAGLFSRIGTTYGPGDGLSTFNIPDLRAQYIRGWDNGRGIDTGRIFGSFQADDMQNHSHTIGNHSHSLSASGSAADNGAHQHAVGVLLTTIDGSHSHSVGVSGSTSSTGGGATSSPSLSGTGVQVGDLALMYCIKY